MLAASPPATLEEIAEKSGLPLERVEAMVEPLFLKGLASLTPVVRRAQLIRGSAWLQRSSAVSTQEAKSFRSSGKLS